MFLNILAKRNWSLNLCLLYDWTVSLWFTNIEQITITPALFHYEKYLLQMQVSVVCIVWIGGEFYTSIKQWFATQLEPNDTLKQKLLCKNIGFISWENKSEFWWVNMDGNAPCNYKKNQVICLSYIWHLQLVWYAYVAMNTEINGTANSIVGIYSGMSHVRSVHM